MLAPTSGRAWVLGLAPLGQGPALRRRTRVLTETPSLDERLTGRENLEIYAMLYGVPRHDIAARVIELMEVFQLDGRADEKAGDYSKGMKQRLALARALIHRPELLFLDEPTSGLDPVAARLVHDTITHLSHDEECTVFLCTHNLDEAQKLCDRVAVLEHGKVVALGTPAELARKIGRGQRLELQVARGDEDEDTVLRLLTEAPGVSAHRENGTLVATGAVRGYSWADHIFGLCRGAHLPCGAPVGVLQGRLLCSPGTCPPDQRPNNHRKNGELTVPPFMLYWVRQGTLLGAVLRTAE